MLMSALSSSARAGYDYQHVVVAISPAPQYGAETIAISPATEVWPRASKLVIFSLPRRSEAEFVAELSRPARRCTMANPAGEPLCDEVLYGVQPGHLRGIIAHETLSAASDRSMSSVTLCMDRETSRRQSTDRRAVQSRRRSRV